MLRSNQRIYDEVMLKIFYIGGSGSSTGVLRAVLCEARFSDLASSELFLYRGLKFPEQSLGGSENTIVEVSAEEGPGACQSGFYSIEKSPVQFEEILKTLPG
jgi:hypothetical protein